MTKHQQVATGWMTVIVLLMTLLGWRVYLRTEEHSRLILSLLYADAVVGVIGYYAVGEFESPNVACVSLLIFMAPLFGPKRHAWGLATLMTVLYGSLLTLRQTGLIGYAPVLPPPDLLPLVEDLPVAVWVFTRLVSEQFGHELLALQLSDATFVGDSLLGFIILVFGAAFLAGEASLGLVTSQQELEGEVDNATRKLSRANLELQDRNRALDEFNSALSHDLKSPLGTSLLAAEALLFGQPPLTAGQQELAKAIADSSERMGDLVRELLKLSRMDSDLGKWVQIELEETFEAVQADLAAKLQETGAVVQVRGPLPPALGNPSLLREAFQNLLENAIKYGGKDGAPAQVLVEETDAPWARVSIAIEDNGPGIPEAERDLVFRPFLQLHRDQGKDGVGAGLAIVRRIVSVHGGRIRVEEGKTLGGARFVLELPRPGTIDTFAG